MLFLLQERDSMLGLRVWFSLDRCSSCSATLQFKHCCSKTTNKCRVQQVCFCLDRRLSEIFSRDETHFWFQAETLIH